MPIGADRNLQNEGLLEQELARLRAALMARDAELQRCQQDAAKVVYALDCAMQQIDAMMMFLMPEGKPLHESVAGARERLREAMKVIHRP